MVDAGIRLLSLMNQLAHAGQQVLLQFEQGSEEVSSYLNRIGFFDLLHPSVTTSPSRPSESAAAFFAGTNPGVVELSRICPTERDHSIPSQLANAIEQACSERSDCATLGLAAFTLFAELVGNIYEHSGTQIDGYAALQLYRNGGSVIAVVSDSGNGILETLRPSLAGTALATYADADLVIHMLNRGISRFGAGRGCGLHQCARHALKYGAELTLRLPNSSLRLVPSGNGYQATGYTMTELPHLRGTHIAFKFQLGSTPG